MDLYHLNNSELDAKIKTLAQKERELLHEVLLHINEADRRRLYLELAYPSLFSYLTEGCGYSAAAAQRRIDAARLITSVPIVADKIKSGEISLSQVSLLQKSIREKNKKACEKVLPEQKQEIIENLSNKSMPESQKLIAQSLDLKLQVSPKEIYQKDESVRLELSFTKEQWEQLIRAREFLSNAVGSNDWAEMFSYLAEQVIGQKVVKDKPVAKSQNGTSDAELNRPSKVSIHTARKSIPITIKRKVLDRDQVCQYRGKKTGRICGSRWRLQIDHQRPVWANGGNEESNLRVLCQRHNNFIYQKQAGIHTAVRGRIEQFRLQRT